MFFFFKTTNTSRYNTKQLGYGKGRNGKKVYPDKTEDKNYKLKSTSEYVSKNGCEWDSNPFSAIFADIFQS